MRNYEIMYILKADLDEAAREAEMGNIQKLLEKNGAKVNNTDTKMGLRELAHEIKDQTKGFYVILKVEADEAALYQFNRKVKINPASITYLKRKAMISTECVNKFFRIVHILFRKAGLYDYVLGRII